MSAARSDWRETVRVGADVALLGIAVTAAALPVLTAGAAVATGSAALHHHLRHDGWPGPAALWPVFRRSLLPGLLAVTVCAVVAALLALDLRALHRGVVPGGRPVIVLTAALASAAAGWAALVVVAVGARDGRGWPAAVRAATVTAISRPGTLLAAAGVVALAAVLGLLVHPALTPTLLGYALFALHAVTLRGRAAALEGAAVDHGLCTTRDAARSS